VLDNPFWHALRTDHARFARGGPAVVAYPPEIAPFAAVERDGARLSADDLNEALGDAEIAYFVHRLPALDGSFPAEPRPSVVEMVWRPQRLARIDLPDATIEPLGDQWLDGMVDLTSRVFPGYFRRRTPDMGRYFGIVQGGRLAAMGGERISLTGHREVSAVCTDPAFIGRGYARAIVTHLVARLADEGIVPFLHVNAENSRARAVYRAVGFVETSEAVRLLRVRRPGARPGRA
jgi:ribosomal protein S18 acetylase RimI-like enzyme